MSAPPWRRYTVEERAEVASCYLLITDRSYFYCGQIVRISVPLLDHVGKLLSLGRDKCDCAFNFSKTKSAPIASWHMRCAALMDFLLTPRFERVRDLARWYRL